MNIDLFTTFLVDFFLEKFGQHYSIFAYTIFLHCLPLKKITSALALLRMKNEVRFQHKLLCTSVYAVCVRVNSCVHKKKYERTTNRTKKKTTK